MTFNILTFILYCAAVWILYRICMKDFEVMFGKEQVEKNKAGVWFYALAGSFTLIQGFMLILGGLGKLLMWLVGL